MNTEDDEREKERKRKNYQDWYNRTKSQRKEKNGQHNKIGYERRLAPEFTDCEDCRTCEKTECRHNHKKIG